MAAPNLANPRRWSHSRKLYRCPALHGKVCSRPAFSRFFAFIGFEDMVNVAEEVKNPQRTMPLGIMLAFIIATILYVLIVLVALMTIEPAALGASEAPLADVYFAATGEKATFISLIGLIAVINGGLIQIIMASRIFFGMSRNGWLPAT